MNDYTSLSPEVNNSIDISSGAGVGVSPEPPLTNRGVGGSHNSSDGSIFGLDWLSLTLHCSVERAREYAAFLGLADGLTSLGHGGTGFRSIEVGLHGFRLYSEPSNGGQYCSFWLPGKCVNHVGVEKIVGLIARLYEDGVRWECTRLDLAFDTQAFKVGDVVAAYEAKLLQTAARKFRRLWDSDAGDTFYVGSRTSTALLRVYNKLVEGHPVFGSEHFTRVELELHDERASMALACLVAADLSEWSALAGGLLSGFVSVKTDWWASWLGDVAASWLRLRRKIPTVDSIKRWLHKQVAPSLAVYFLGLSGGDVDSMDLLLRELLKEGQSRFKDMHHALVDGCSAAEPERFAVFAL